MEESTQKRLLGGLILLIMAALTFGIFFSAFNRPSNVTWRNAMEKQAPPAVQPPPSPIRDNRFSLFRGEPLTVFRKQLVYHGLEDGKLHVAVTILDLDPEFAYHHYLPVKAAKQRGLLLGGQRFDLVSYGRNSLKLEVTGAWRTN